MFGGVSVADRKSLGFGGHAKLWEFWWYTATIRFRMLKFGGLRELRFYAAWALERHNLSKSVLLPRGILPIPLEKLMFRRPSRFLEP